jgi:hypothetical protein
MVPRILAIVSTTSISISASQTTGRPVWTLFPGVPFGSRSPRKRALDTKVGERCIALTTRCDMIREQRALPLAVAPKLREDQQDAI